MNFDQKMDFAQKTELDLKMEFNSMIRNLKQKWILIQRLNLLQKWILIQKMNISS